MEQRPRQGGALVLATGQFADAREYLVFKPQRRQHLADLFYVPARRQHQVAQVAPDRPLVKAAHIDIVKDRQRLNQRRILRHQRGSAAETLIEKAEQGRFPCSAFPDKRDSLAGLDSQREPSQNLLAVIPGGFVFELKQGHQSIRPIDFAVFSIGA